MRKILILGGASAIAFETAKKFAADGDRLFLADLMLNRLEILREDINARFPTDIGIAEFNALDFTGHPDILQKADEYLGSIDIALIAYGTLPDQELMQSDVSKAVEQFNLNCTSIISLCTIISNYFEEKGAGTLAVISSVAGDRGRQSNYLYGAAKGCITTFLQGLRNRLSKKNVQIITIKPGQVDTPMTADMPKSPLFVKPVVVGQGIYKAIIQQKDVVYLPGWWKLIMFIVKIIPEGIFKKLNF